MKCIKKLVALTLAAVLALTMLTACGGKVPTTPVEKIEAQEIVDNINAVRTKNGLSELRINATATETAAQWGTLHDQYRRKEITWDTFNDQCQVYGSVQVEGRRYRGYLPMFITMSPKDHLTESYWQGMYDENRDYCGTWVVTDPDTSYIGVSIQKAVDGQYVIVILTY